MTSILNARLWPRIGLDHAPTKNAHLKNHPTVRGDLAQQLLLYDQVVLPTNDFGILPILLDWMGLRIVQSLLETDSLYFLRQKGCLGYAGNGNALTLFNVYETKEHPFQWWQRAMFGDTETALDLQLTHSCAELTASQRKKLLELVLHHHSEVNLPNQVFMPAIVHETYTDIMQSPDLSQAIQEFYGCPPRPIDLKRLPEIGPNQLKVSGVEAPRDPTDMLLQVAEINLEILISSSLSSCDIFTAFDTDGLLKNKLRRSGLADSKITGFSSILELCAIPDVGGAVNRGVLSFAAIWDKRQTKVSRKFRNWLAAANPTNVREMEMAYVAALGKEAPISSLPFRILRFCVTTSVGILNPIAGMGTSVADSFFVEKWFSGYSPKLFIDELRTLEIERNDTA